MPRAAHDSSHRRSSHPVDQGRPPSGVPRGGDCRPPRTRIATIFNARREISRILRRARSPPAGLVGPCSIHDTKAAREYAALLKTAIDEFSDDLAHRHARLLRKAAHHRRLEGPHQRSASRRVLQDQRRPAPRAASSARSRRDGRSRRHRIPRHDHAAVHRRPGQLGSHRRAHHRKPGPSPARLAASPAPSASRTEPPATCRSPSKPCSPPRIRTRFSATPSTASRPSSSPPAIPIATSFCAAAASW